MNTELLRATYDRFLEAADAQPTRSPADGWGAASIVAHVTINNRLIAAHVARVLEKHPRPYDNIPAQNDDLLRAVVASNRNWTSLVEAARRSCQEVLALANLVDGRLGKTEQHVLVRDGHRAMVDGDVAVADVLAIQAQVHIPAHTDQLRALEEAAHQRDSTRRRSANESPQALVTYAEPRARHESSQ